jgi:hypothetical protein
MATPTVRLWELTNKLINTAIPISETTSTQIYFPIKTGLELIMLREPMKV